MSGQQKISFDPPSNGVATSDAAAESMRGQTALIRERIRQFIVSRHVVGATADEIEQMLEIAGNTVRPRLVELRHLGLIKDSFQTRKTRSGRQATIWVGA